VEKFTTNNVDLVIDHLENEEFIANQKYYKFNLEEKYIRVIENQDDLFFFIDEMDKNSKTTGENQTYYVGVDTEWLPTCATGLGVENKKKVALIQIATEGMVYLLDMVKLIKYIDEQISKAFAKKFLFNKRIVKVGYGFTHDIKMICEAFVNLTETDLLRQTSIDLAYLVGQVGC